MKRTQYGAKANGSEKTTWVDDWARGARFCTSLALTVLQAAGVGVVLTGAAMAGIGAVNHKSAEKRDAEVQLTAFVQEKKPDPVLLVDLDGDGLVDLANPTTGQLRALDAYGEGRFGASRDSGARTHAGTDFVAAPGSPVLAPIGGMITKIGHAYDGDTGLRFVEITMPESGVAARVFYVDPIVAVGAAVGAGASIGVAQDLTGRYPHGMTNHVHVEIVDGAGVHVDPAKVLPVAPTRSAAVRNHLPRG